MRVAVAKYTIGAPRSFAERCMSQIIYWGEPEKGGHFAALEQPAVFVNELRGWARCLPAGEGA